MKAQLTKAQFLFSALLLALLAPATVAPAQWEAPGVASTVPNPEYPLHIRVLSQGERVHNRFGVHSFGRADLLGNPVRGFDYAFDCYAGFLHNANGEFYQGRWKKPDQKIEILVQRVGSNHVDKCELNVTLKAEPYGRYGPAGAPAPATPPTL
jgi:hypothetical protein